MEKKLYWLIENNYDLSITCDNTTTCLELLKVDFETMNDTVQKEIQYTITPVWYTKKEYEKLPEAE